MKRSERKIAESNALRGRRGQETEQRFHILKMERNQESVASALKGEGTAAFRLQKCLRYPLEVEIKRLFAITAKKYRRLQKSLEISVAKGEAEKLRQATLSLGVSAEIQTFWVIRKN